MIEFSFINSFVRKLVRLFIFVFCMLPFWVNAHVVEKGHGIVNLVGSEATIAISVPMDIFLQADLNNDGFISELEIQAQLPQLIAKVQSGVRLWGDNTSAVWKDIFLTPSIPDVDKANTPNSEQRQILMMGVAYWESPPSVITLDYALWRRPEVSELNTQGFPSETLKVKVFRTKDGVKISEEVGLLSENHPRLEFFAPVHRHIINFAFHGFDHIIRGADHIVFLVALLASGISFWRWGALLTAFTLAHGITFGLASLGWVNVPAEFVEPAIAASIVVVSSIHLLKIRIKRLWEVSLVFSLGLIHGLGFASSMQNEGASQAISLSPYPIWSIFGFNIGIEVGQFTVAVILYATIWGLRRVFGLEKDVIWQRATGIFSIVIGSIWFIDRI